MLESFIFAGEVPNPSEPEWSIRLIVSMPTEGLVDSQNTIGIARNSLAEKDKYDIPDQLRPTWIKSYLDLIIPHPEWEGDLTNFSSDFRADNSKKTLVERWFFEVRSNLMNKDVNFAWHGPKHILIHCRLLDGNNEKILVSDLVNEGYTFTMTQPVHSFIWEYRY